MARTVSKPGPPPQSCLTCRQRRKKCDRSKPKCKRCLKGGFECLGYGGPDPRPKVRPEGPNTLAGSLTRPNSELDPVEMAPTPDSKSITKDPQGPTNTDMDYDSRPSILGAALLYRLSKPASLTNEENSTTDPLEDFGRSWMQCQSQLSVYSRKSRVNGPKRVFNALCQSIPPLVDMKEDRFERIMHEHDSQRSNYWFMSPPSATRRPLLAQLKLSKGMTWAFYLEARLFQALDEYPYSSGSTVHGYIAYIDKIEQKFTLDSHNGMTLGEVVDRFAVQLELAFLKFAAVDSALGYDLLRKALPRFLQIVAADSDLHKELPNRNLVVSFPHTLSAPRYELRRFVLCDAITSFIFGVPPFVDYAYDVECDAMSHGLEWVHGIPVLILQIVSQINSWRASSRTSGWEALETRILAWEPSEDSATDAARVAVREGWRHIVLIYLYMGLCGVSSDDSRVQASVHRIVQLGETVTNLPIGVHMFTHCVVAGLAARLERHRMLVHRMLLSFKGARVWFFQGLQFSQVLYHLWHGVGVKGAPVKWDDYVESRCAIVPI
ncbi:unnamed protein product [Rhizoctonia solani]|uniref:Zn(2)-C6 fungal-type domain-containing protein n=1 Tax=Rhizoctonia solani TaxID=456999 RepID=A0A8H3DDJ1_9AGAM|nr:unnamed protein product [Rhizoctonia solani]